MLVGLFSYGEMEIIKENIGKANITALNMGICARVFAAAYWKNKLAD
jgi:hypothetical protein